MYSTLYVYITYKFNILRDTARHKAAIVGA